MGKYQKFRVFTNLEWIFMKLLLSNKYNIKKEKDNTYNKTVDSVDKKLRNEGRGCLI
jgi:hypothetical protein